MNKNRGILMPIASLPNALGVGDFGGSAYAFVDLLVKAKFSYWQLLPLNPLGFGHSPYQSASSYAFDELYISLPDLHKKGWLDKFEEYRPKSTVINYEGARAHKEKYLRRAYENFLKGNVGILDTFKKKHPQILEYAQFRAMKTLNGERGWDNWTTFDVFDEKEVNYHIFLQYVLYQEWDRLHRYANNHGITIVGDLPFYVGYDSAEVYYHRNNFILDEKGTPTVVAGVSPDYFSADGQRWGNPIYNFEEMRKDGFDFILSRIGHCLNVYDILRIDHFRAFDTYYVIPASCPTAREGNWVEAPRYEIFDKLYQRYPNANIIAEDLGNLRPEVYYLRDHYQLPGMCVLQFAFNDLYLWNKGYDTSNLITYIGTHDNDTLAGDISKKEGYFDELTNFFKANNAYHHNLIDSYISWALNMPSKLVILLPQDILHEGTKRRINKPSIVDNENWTYRLNSFTKLRRALRKDIYKY